MEQLTMNSISPYAHLVKVDEESRKLTIYRVSESGERSLFTCVDLPELDPGNEEETLTNFTKTLGENLLLDSPAARKLLGL